MNLIPANRKRLFKVKQGRDNRHLVNNPSEIFAKGRALVLPVGVTVSPYAHSKRITVSQCVANV